MLRKKIMATVIAATVMFTGINFTTSEAAQEVKVKVDGREIYFPDAKPFIDSASRTLIPLRFVSEALGAQVDWNSKERAAGVKKGSNKLILFIGSKEIIKTDGSKLAMDTSAQIYQNRTYVPLRFVSEALGAKVAWEKLTYTVVITTDGSEPQISNETSKTVVKNGKTYQISDKHPMLVVGVEKFDEPTFLLLEGNAGYNKYSNGIRVSIWGMFNDDAPGYFEKEYTKEEVMEMNKRGIPSPKQLAWYLSSNPGVSDPSHIPDNKKTFEYAENFDYSGNSAYSIKITNNKERWDNYKSKIVYSKPQIFGKVVTFENDKACFNDTRYNDAPGGYIRRCLPLE